MSSESGERWAVVTLQNLTSGKRVFDNHQLLGLFADGSRSAPLEFKQNFDANETLSLNLFFGNSHFPLLQVYSYN